MDEMILETERLVLRKLEQSDFREACKLLQDPEVMYAYEGAFSDQEVQVWLDKMFRRYENDGFALWAVVEKGSGELIGQCGITYQEYNGRKSVICSGKNFGIKDLLQRQLLLVKSMLFRFWILMMFIPLFEIRTWPPRMWHDETE